VCFALDVLRLPPFVGVSRKRNSTRIYGEEGEVEEVEEVEEVLLLYIDIILHFKAATFGVPPSISMLPFNLSII